MLSEPEPKRIAKRSFLVWGVWFLLAGIAALLLLPTWTSISIGNRSSKALNQAKQLGLGCKLYANDHGGEFPLTLHVLTPEYVFKEGFEKLMRSRVDEKGEFSDFLYFAGLREDSPPDLPLIASATAGRNDGATTGSKVAGRRVLLLVDQSAAIVREEEYQAAVGRYREWIRKRDEKR